MIYALWGETVICICAFVMCDESIRHTYISFLFGRLLSDADHQTIMTYSFSLLLLIPLIHSLWVYALLQCVTTWLQAQGITRPIAVTSAAAALLHPLLNWLFIKPCGLGAIGSAVATALTQAIWLAMLIVYICWYGVAAQTGLAWPSRKELRQTLRHDPWPFLQVRSLVDKIGDIS